MITNSNKQTDCFIEAKPRLMGIAYRMLGTCKDAEDIVQNVYLKFEQADFDTIENPGAWLTTVCTRQCLDFMKSAQQNRLEYVGTWLPEPVSESYGSEYFMELSASLSSAFLLMLERLSPKERAVFLLREIFDQDYTVIAASLDMSEQACRKILSRARKHIGQEECRSDVDPEHQALLFNHFKKAVEQGDVKNLQGYLAEGVKLSADGGGKVEALDNDIRGISNVSNFISKGLHKFWQGCSWHLTHISGQPGVIVRQDERIHAIVSFGYRDQKVSEILIVRNPDKMATFQQNTGAEDEQKPA